MTDSADERGRPVNLDLLGEPADGDRRSQGRRFGYLWVRPRVAERVSVRLLVGDVRRALATLPDGSVHCVVTSPPYYGLRDYRTEPQVWGGDPTCDHEWGTVERGKKGDREPGEGLAGNDAIGVREYAQGGAPLDGGRFCLRCGAWRGHLGLEPTPSLYIAHLVEVFQAVRRVLRDDGTLWLNVGDSYASGNRSTHQSGASGNKGHPVQDGMSRPADGSGIKPKDLLGVPWMLAFALRDDGWYLRSEVTWAKEAPMPESVGDRPTSATEKVFLLTKSERYFWDREAGKEDGSENEPWAKSSNVGDKARLVRNDGNPINLGRSAKSLDGKRNMRNWWRMPPDPFPGAHFATFPRELPFRCLSVGTSEAGVCPRCGAPWVRVVRKSGDTPRGKASYRGWSTKADGKGLSKQGLDYAGGHGSNFRRCDTIGWRLGCGCEAGDPVPSTVLDPFSGAGTTALVAAQLGCHAVAIDLSAEYAKVARLRIEADVGSLGYAAVEVEAVA